MYQKAAAGLGAGGGALLPFTGGNVVYLVLAAFALLAAGAAMLRVMPKRRTVKQ